MSILKSLNREQKEAVGLLQIGTFLEYFDLMLYVHMAVLLNELFFPKTDPHTAALLSAFAFCSTFLLRPFGAIIFGYIGDHIGRKTTVVMTTLMMSLSCIIMANLPTYAQIGISAAWIVTICRIMQGLSSMGEVIGAFVYMTEITKPPVRYPAVAFINVAGTAGALAALGIATLVTKYEFNWRIAFWIGAGIAVVGSIARTRLRETADFIESKHRSELKKLKALEKAKNPEFTRANILSVDGSEKKTLLAFFLIYCGRPVCFYLAYIYFNQTLMTQHGFSSADIIYNNFLLAIFDLSSCFFVSILSYKISPLKILTFKSWFFIGFGIILPFCIFNATTASHIFAIQAIILLMPLDDCPANGMLINLIPVLKRMTEASVLYALARAIIYAATSFGLVYLVELWGHYGIWIIVIPTTLGFLWGTKHFEKLEKSYVKKNGDSFDSTKQKIDISVGV